MSGVTGVGGGIFLAPLVLSLGWATTRQTAAISVVFNLVNSAAALAGSWATLPLLPARLPVWLLCLGFGGLLGSWVGALHLNPRTLRLLLAFLLLAAAGANDRRLVLGKHATPALSPFWLVDYGREAFAGGVHLAVADVAARSTERGTLHTHPRSRRPKRPSRSRPQAGRSASPRGLRGIATRSRRRFWVARPTSTSS